MRRGHGPHHGRHSLALIDIELHRKYHAPVDERRHVQVIVAGYPGSGKTTVATLLRDALSAHGHDDVEIVDMALDDDDPTPDIVERRLRSMKENGHTIGIQVRQLRTPITGMGK